MSDDDKPNPARDLKQGLGLLFRAAKGAVESLPTGKLEDAVKDGAKEVERAFETVATELDKVWNKATGTGEPPKAAAPPNDPPAAADASAEDPAKKKDEKPFDDAYAPEPPKGPRIG